MDMDVDMEMDIFLTRSIKGGHKKALKGKHL